MTKREMKKMLSLSKDGVHDIIVFAMIAQLTTKAISELDAVNIALNISEFLQEKMENKP